MKKNKLRELLNEGKPTLGTHVISPWPGMVELIGQSNGFDYIEYVGEYSTFSLEQMDNFGRAIELFPDMSSMMKVEEQLKGFVATRSVDAGIQNLLFTDVRSAEEVRECIQLIRAETPEDGGVHGCGMRRGAGYFYGSGPDWVKAMQDVVCAFMIEKKGAMENLEEILSIPGVDMVQFGPSDYSISIGKPGQGGSPEVQKVQRDMIEMALKHNVAPRVELGSFEQAKPFVDMGVRHFCIGWDVRTIYAWCEKERDGMQELLASA
jgi:2-keto-3-deoxy-L-rhamnonate aldolase RhmA